MLCQGWRSHMSDLYKAIFRELPLLEKNQKRLFLLDLFLKYRYHFT